MRLHTSLTADDLFDALNLAKQHGLITHDVRFDPITAYNSQTHPRAYEIQLGASQGGGLPAGYTNQYGKRQKCRRTRNGNYTRDLRFAATWHEWGWLMALIYRADPNARWGSKASAANMWGRGGYQNRDDFHNKTHGDFAGVLVNG
jgi:hypothetical protein